jgi:hypothetical protein
MAPSGTGQVPLTSNPADDAVPDFSPDGSLIVFFSLRDGSAQIYVMGAAGGGERRLVASGAAEASPAWQPVAAPSAQSPSTPAASPLALSRTRLSGRHRPRGLRARLVVRGTSTSAGTFDIGLRRRSGPPAVGLLTATTRRLRLAAPGPFVARLALPRRLAPGRYALMTGGDAVQGRAGRVTIPRPPSGVLLRSFASAAQNGPLRSSCRAVPASCSAASTSRSSPCADP